MKENATSDFRPETSPDKKSNTFSQVLQNRPFLRYELKHTEYRNDHEIL